MLYFPKQSDIDSTFHDIVRKHRLEKKISLRAFATKIGLSPSYVSLMERGLACPPSHDPIVKIARVLELDHHFMLAKAGKVHYTVKDAITKNPMLPYILEKIKDALVFDVITHKGTTSLVAPYCGEIVFKDE